MATNIPPHNLRGGRRRRPVVPRAPGGDRRRSCSRPCIARIPGPGLPDRARSSSGETASRTPTAPAAAASGCVRSCEVEEDKGRTRAGRHRAAVPGQPGLRSPRRSPSSSRTAGSAASPTSPTSRSAAHRSAAGHHAQARRRRQGRAEQPLQAHPAAGHVRRQHAGDRRRGAAHAAPRRDGPATTSRTRSTSSCAGPASSCARRGSGCTSSRACSSRSTISTRSSR